MTNEVPGPSNLPRGRAATAATRSSASRRAGEPWQTKLTDEEGKPILPFLIVDWVEWEGPIAGAVADAGPAAVPAEAKGERTSAQAREALVAVRRARLPPAGDGRPRWSGSSKLVESEIAERREVRRGAEDRPAGGPLLQGFPLPRRRLAGRSRDARSTTGNWRRGCRISSGARCRTTPLFDAARAGTLHRAGGAAGAGRRGCCATRRSPGSPTRSRGSGCNCAASACSRRTRSSTPTTTTTCRRAWSARRRPSSARCWTKNLSLREFLDSDWTMLNARLAEHYGIPDVTEDRFAARRAAAGRPPRRAADPGRDPEPHLRRHPAPPGASRQVGAGIDLRQVAAAAAGQRQADRADAGHAAEGHAAMKLAAHKSDANCAACHRKIDPLGLAFDNYDAIGRWRTEEVVSDGSGDNPKVDASGELPDGRKFDDAGGVQEAAARRPRQVQRRVRREARHLRPAPHDDARRPRRAGRRSPGRARPPTTGWRRSSKRWCCPTCFRRR